MKETEKYSFGIGDRFSPKGRAHIEALVKASAELGEVYTNALRANADVN